MRFGSSRNTEVYRRLHHTRLRSTGVDVVHLPDGCGQRLLSPPHDKNSGAILHEGRASDIAIPARDECDLASEFRHTGALWTSAQFRVLTAQHETRRARFGDLFAALIGDSAFNVPDIFAPIDDALRRGAAYCRGHRHCRRRYRGESADKMLLYSSPERGQMRDRVSSPAPQSVS